MALKLKHRVDESQKHEYDINQVIFDKGKLFTAADDGKIKVWNPNLQLLHEIQAHPCSVYSLTLSENAIYSCSNDGTVKVWDLNTFQEKQTLINEENTEFWKLKYTDDVLYVGDDQGNVRIYKNGDKFFGSFNVAIPVKDLAIQQNIIYASKDNDIIVTDLKLTGEKPTFGVKATIVGRGPLAVCDDMAVFMTRDGRSIVLNSVPEKHQQISQLSQFNDAHEMIINAAALRKCNEEYILFTGGWDKNLKKWKIQQNSILSDGSYTLDYIIHSVAISEEKKIYVAGENGHLVAFEF